MKKTTVILTFILTVFLLSCTPQKQEDGNQGGGVDIKTAGIFNTPDFYLAGGNTDLGEFLIGDDPHVFTIWFRNNSTYPLTNVVLDVDENSSAAMKYNPDEEGKSYAPGFGGTCTSTIAPGQLCKWMIQYNPTISGQLSQKLAVSYKNLVNPGSDEINLTLLAGEAASLIFTNDETTYSLGVLERTDRIVYTTDLEVKNAGGLTARSVNFSEFPSPNSGAYRLVDNTCGVEIKKGEICTFRVEWEPMNYDGTAPDGNSEVSYINTYTINYIRDPKGGQGNLNAYFDVLATTIEARMRHGGLDEVEFSDLVVGNTTTKTVKIVNQGYKEAILHSFDFRDNVGTTIAKCVKPAPGLDLECRDPADPGNPAAKLTTKQLPFRVKDLNNCFDEYSKMSYTRNPDGTLSDETIKVVNGKDGDIPGEACFFELTFHPSVKYLADGNWNDTQIIVIYDSTWKNNIVMYNESSGDTRNFALTKAQYFAAANIEIDEFRYNNAVLSRLCEFTTGACGGSDCTGTADPNNTVVGTTAGDIYYDSTNDLCYKYSGTGDVWYLDDLYDLGRVALISSAAYAQGLSFKYENTGGYYADIVSIKDGNATPFTVTASSQNINDYWRNVNHVGCTTLDVGQKCDVTMSLAPLAGSGGSPEVYENGNMYDRLAAYPDRYKDFIIEYKDGTTYEDDMSPRPNRTLQVSMRGLLVRKGYLVFEDTSTQQGRVTQKTFGDEEYFHVLLKNVGTGAIPYIGAVATRSLKGTTQKAADDPYPYEFVDRTGPEAGANKDCYDFMFWDEADPTTDPDHAALDIPGGELAISGVPAAKILSPGENCSLTVRMKMRRKDRKTAYNPNTGTTNIEFWRFFDIETDEATFDDNGTEDHDDLTRAGWEWELGPTNDQPIQFYFYDGDGAPSPPTGYTPQRDGYGNYYVIGGGSNNQYNIRFGASTPAHFVPDLPDPMINGMLYRPAITTPDIIVGAPDWGANLTGSSLAAQFMYRGIASTPTPPASYVGAAQTHFSGGGAFVSQLANQEYTYHGGTYKAGTGPFNYGFSLYNRGNKTARNISITCTGCDANVAMTSSASPPNTNPNDLIPVKFDFNPPAGLGAATEYTVYIDIEYENGSRILTDSSTPLDPSNGSADYTKRVVKTTMMVVFEAVPAAEGEVSIVSQTYQVDYDPLSPLNPLPAPGPNNPDETLLAPTTPITLGWNGIDAGFEDRYKAIKGSPIYVKKIYTLTNSGGTDLNDLKFTIKATTTAFRDAPTTAGSGYSIISNTCSGITVAPLGTCQFEVKFKADLNEPALPPIIGHISYAIAPNQYISRMWQIPLEANDPATVQLAGVNTFNIDDGSGGTIQNAYPINLGFYNNAGHPILSDYPTQAKVRSNINVENLSATKASFLKQYRDFIGNPSASIPGGTWIEIYNNDNKKMEANRGCFYGDDEGGPDPDTWGFNDTTSNVCQFRFTYDFDDRYLGEKIEEGTNWIPLKYYDNDRNSSSTMYVYIKGFVEPNQSTVADINLYNVSSTSDGTVSFDWVDSSPGNASWGTRIGYRVYYTANKNQLNDVYNNLGIQYEDVPSNTVTLTNLTRGKMYYYKIVARRRTPISSKDYISDITNMPVHQIIVPPLDTIYDHDNLAIIDKYMSPQGSPAFELKDDAKTVCTSQSTILSRNGSNVSASKKLINLAIFDIIDADPNGNSDYPYGSYPHWMADDPMPIAPYFPLYSCSDTSGDDIADNEFFQKSCGDCSCDTLSVLKGGDGFFLPVGATIFSEGDANTGAARCYIDVAPLLL